MVGGKNFIELDNERSNFPDEKEVLLQEGLEFNIENIVEVKTDILKYFLVTLRYEAQS